MLRLCVLIACIAGLSGAAMAATDPGGILFRARYLPSLTLTPTDRAPTADSLQFAVTPMTAAALVEAKPKAFLKGAVAAGEPLAGIRTSAGQVFYCTQNRRMPPDYRMCLLDGDGDGAFEWECQGQSDQYTGAGFIGFPKDFGLAVAAISNCSRTDAPLAYRALSAPDLPSTPLVMRFSGKGDEVEVKLSFIDAQNRERSLVTEHARVSDAGANLIAGARVQLTRTAAGDLRARVLDVNPAPDL